MKRSVLLPAVLALLFAGFPAAAQDASADPVPDRQEASRLFAEIVDLMNTSAIVVPELARAGAPLTENVRSAAETLETGSSADHVGVLYRLLTNAKVYLQLTDALPKPPGFSEDVRRQLGQLRRDVDLVDLYFRDLLERREQQVRGSDRDNFGRYSDANEQLPPPAEGENRVVFLGDSITDGWLLNQFFPGKAYLNRGIGGQITGQMLGRMNPDVIDLQPEVMVFHGGTNDIARDVPQEVIYSNIEAITMLAEAAGITPVIGNLLPVSDYHAEENPRYRRTAARPLGEIRQINAWIREFCDAKGYAMIDYYSAFADDRGQLPAELADDGLHPNTEGYKIMARLASEAVEYALDAKTDRRSKKKRGLFRVF